MIKRGQSRDSGRELAEEADNSAVGLNVFSIALVVVIASFAVSIRRFGVLQRQVARNAPPGQAAARRSAGGWTFLIVGGIGFLTNAALFISADADLRAYRDSASCRAGLVLAAELDGTCRVGSAIIENAYRTTGKGAATHVVLGFADGHTESVIEQRVLHGGVLAGFRDANDRDATVQQFRGRTALVQTRSGAFETLNMPIERVNEWGVFGIVFGVCGLIGALMLAFR